MSEIKELRKIVDDLTFATDKLKDADGLQSAPQVMSEIHLLAKKLEKTKPMAIGLALFFSILGGSLTGLTAGYYLSDSRSLNFSKNGVSVFVGDDFVQYYIPKEFEVLEYDDTHHLLQRTINK